MNIRIHSSIAAAVAVAVLSMSAPQPVKANTFSTLLIGAAAAGAAFTAINVNNKNRKANSLAGYLPNGDAAYQDGHVTTRSGGKYYPGDHGQTLECSNQRCRIVGTNGNYNGHHYRMTHNGG